MLFNLSYELSGSVIEVDQQKADDDSQE